MLTGRNDVEKQSLTMVGRNAKSHIVFRKYSAQNRVQAMTNSRINYDKVLCY